MATYTKDKDVETVLEENSRFEYYDRLGLEQFTQQISIISIDTDEGVLDPGSRRSTHRGSILETTGTNKSSRSSLFKVHRRKLWQINYILVETQNFTSN